MSYDEEQLYFLGVESNDDWTVQSGPIRKLKGKCSQGFCRWTICATLLGFAIMTSSIVQWFWWWRWLWRWIVSEGGGHLDVVLMFMKTWLRLNTGKLSDSSPQLASSSQPPSRHHIITITITSTSQATSHIYHTHIIGVGDTWVF